MKTADDIQSVHGAVGAAFRLAYHHSIATGVISALWVLASIPIVTIGPATLGAYTAVQSIYQDGTVNRSRVRGVLVRQWLHATLLGGVLVLLAGLTLAYIGQYLETGAFLAGLFGVLGLYLTMHLWAVLVVAFVALADGAEVYEAVTSGYWWTVRHPVDTALLGIVSASLFVGNLLLTIAVVLVFPFVLFAFHIGLVSDSATARA